MRVYLFGGPFDGQRRDVPKRDAFLWVDHDSPLIVCGSLADAGDPRGRFALYVRNGDGPGGLPCYEFRGPKVPLKAGDD